MTEGYPSGLPGQHSDVEQAQESGALPAGQQRPGMFGVTGSGDTSGFSGLQRQPWVELPAQRPFGGYFDEVVDAFLAVYPQAQQAIRKIVVDRDELTIHIAREHIALVAKVFRDDPALRFELCSSVSGVDYLAREGKDGERLHVAYQLTSMTYRRRIRLEVSVTDADPHIPSVTAVYPTADWQEREAWDMFGIIFDGHPALTRILMPDDWDGHPQRKDYALGGVAVEYKGAMIPPPDDRRSYR
jgi:NADH-quinone oxidoreductase subunit C